MKCKKARNSFKKSFKFMSERWKWKLKINKRKIKLFPTKLQNKPSRFQK